MPSEQKTPSQQIGRMVSRIFIIIIISAFRKNKRARPLMGLRMSTKMIRSVHNCQSRCRPIYRDAWALKFACATIPAAGAATLAIPAETVHAVSSATPSCSASVRRRRFSPPSCFRTSGVRTRVGQPPLLPVGEPVGLVLRPPRPVLPDPDSRLGGDQSQQ